jgi:hypothetical protein
MPSLAPVYQRTQAEPHPLVTALGGVATYNGEHIVPDCFWCCIATVLGLEYDEPHGPPEWSDEDWAAWALERGLVMRASSAGYPEGRHWIGGYTHWANLDITSNHTAVFDGDRLVHDPEPDPDERPADIPLSRIYQAVWFERVGEPPAPVIEPAEFGRDASIPPAEVRPFVRIRGLLTAGPTTALTAADAFNQSAGALAGKTADIGGAWAGAGSTTDYQVDATNKLLTRTLTAPESSWAGRFAFLGSAAAASAARVDLCDPGPTFGGGPDLALVLRYVNTSNWLLAVVTPITRGFAVYKSVAGVASALTPPGFTLPWLTVGGWASVELYAGAAGDWAAWLVPTGSPIAGVPLFRGKDVDLATGGALASGKVALYSDGPTARVVRFDNLIAWTPAPSHVCASGQGLQVDSQRAVKLDSGLQGDPPLVEGRTYPKAIPGEITRITAKLRRTDVDALPDEGLTDPAQLSVVVTPRVQLLG